MNEETKTAITIRRHINLVQELLYGIIQELERRAIVHDASKYNEDEFGGFVKIQKIAREHPYGSDKYKASLEEVNAVELHYRRNDHHPEYHPVGVDDMNLYQLIEMVVDWKAASITYGQTSFADSLKMQQERFGLNDQQMYVINLIAEALGR